MAASALSLIWAATLRVRSETVIAAISLAVGVALLVPRTLPGPTPDGTPTGPRLVVVVANLAQGRGDAATIVRTVDDEDVDLLVALEVTTDSVAGLRDAGLGPRLPHDEVLPSQLTSGGGIWSRFPLEPLEPSMQRGFGASPRATIAVPGHGPLAVETVHPLPPISAQ